MPKICGYVARKPKVAADAASIMLLGPGVNADTTANRQKDAKFETSITPLPLLYVAVLLPRLIGLTVPRVFYAVKQRK